MSEQVQLRRGTTAQNAAFTGAQGEVVADIQANVLVLHDGFTQGGHPIPSKAYVDTLIAGDTGNVTFSGNTVSTAGTNQNLNIIPNGTGIVYVSNLTVNGSLVGSLTGAASTAATVTAGAQPNITSVGTLTNLTVTGPITGDIIGFLTGTASTALIANNASYLGNIAASGYQLAGTYVTPTTLNNNTLAANVTSLFSTGNVTADYFVGNGSLLSGIIGSENANNASYLGGEVAANYALTGDVIAEANNASYLGGEVAANYLLTTGSAANLTSFPTLNQDTSGSANNASFLGGEVAANYATYVAVNDVLTTNVLEANIYSLKINSMTVGSGSWIPVIDTLSSIGENNVYYRIEDVGTTDFTLYGAASNIIGEIFLANNDPWNDAGTGEVSYAYSPNSGVGIDVLNTNNNSGTKLTGLGYRALGENTGGIDNTAVGFTALGLNQDGSENTAVGYGALAASDANYNTAVGSQALAMTTSGDLNTAVGAQALITNLIGNNNTAVGMQAMSINISGNTNIAVGSQALMTNSTGSNNTALGVNALSNSNATNNIALGYFSGLSIDTGSYNMILGSNDGTGLPDGINGNYGIVLSDGAGNVRITVNSLGEVNIPGNLLVTGNITGNISSVNNAIVYDYLGTVSDQAIYTGNVQLNGSTGVTVTLPAAYSNTNFTIQVQYNGVGFTSGLAGWLYSNASSVSQFTIYSSGATDTNYVFWTTFGSAN